MTAQTVLNGSTHPGLNGTRPTATPPSGPAAGALPPPPVPRTTRSRPPRRRPDLLDRLAQLDSTGAMVGVYYAAVVAGALWGGTEAATHWLEAPVPLAVFLVVVAEIGGVTFGHMADVRQRLGEKPIICWAISATVAAAAVYLQWQGHMHMGQPIPAFFFALLSALGFTAFVLRASHKRRDQRRAEGNLAKPAPSYGIEQWLTEPRVTLLARKLAKDRDLNRVDSIKAAKAQLGLRHHIIAVVREATGKKGRRKARAVLAANPVDLVAEQLGAVVDLDNFVRWIAGTLDPRVTLGGATARPIPAPATATAAVVAAVSRAGVSRAAPPANRPAPARRTTEDSAALYRQLVAQHGLYDQANGTGWKQTDFAAAMGVSPQRLRAIKAGANITDTEGATS